MTASLIAGDVLNSIQDVFPNLSAYLADVRRRPGVHMRVPSVYALYHQIAGISFAEEFHKIPDSQRFIGEEVKLFDAWVNQKFNSVGVASRSFFLAEEIAGSDSSGFELWFEWYDQYIRERNIT